MMRKRLKGMGVAMVTPFTTTGDVDYVALDSLVDMHLASGTDFLCVLGTTAETPTLTKEEKRNIRKRIVEKVAGRLPILLGMGGNCTHNLVEEIKGEDLTGVDAILSVVPYYNKPSQEGIYQHYKAVALATSLPIVLYNVPGRTGENMLPETVIRLANDFENIVAVKEASGNLQQIKTIIDNTPADFDVLSGDDGLICDIMKIGGVGAITVFGNAYPKEFTEMVHHLSNTNYDKADELNTMFAEMYTLLFADGNPAGVKSLMAHQKKIGNNLRLPLVPARAEIDEAMALAMITLDNKLAAR